MAEETLRRCHYANASAITMLGHGSYGSVYRIIFRDGNNAAVKTYDLRDSCQLPADALREISVLSTLKHPNIVSAKDAFFITGKDLLSPPTMICMEMDLANMGTLYDCRHMILDPYFAASQIFSGIAYLHANGVIHRDIKPSNILVNIDSANNITYKLSDLGSAWLYDESRVFREALCQANASGVHPIDTKKTKAMTTAWYRSIDQLMGSTEHTPAMDIWSAALVFLEMLCGVSPIMMPETEEETHQGMVNIISRLMGPPAVVQSSPNYIPNLENMCNYGKYQLPGAPTKSASEAFLAGYGNTTSKCPWVTTVIDRMMSYDPEKRPSAKSVADCLERYINGKDPLPLVDEEDTRTRAGQDLFNRCNQPHALTESCPIEFVPKRGVTAADIYHMCVDLPEMFHNSNSSISKSLVNPDYFTSSRRRAHVAIGVLNRFMSRAPRERVLHEIQDPKHRSAMAIACVTIASSLTDTDTVHPITIELVVKNVTTPEERLDHAYMVNLPSRSLIRDAMCDIITSVNWNLWFPTAVDVELMVASCYEISCDTKVFETAIDMLLMSNIMGGSVDELVAGATLAYYRYNTVGKSMLDPLVEQNATKRVKVLATSLRTFMI